MKIYISILISVFLVIMTGPSLLAEPTIEFELMQWMPDLTAEARVSDEAIQGSDIDFKDELGLDDENFIDARFSWYFAKNNKLRLTYSNIAYSGDKVISEEIVFDGETYEVGGRVITDLDIQYFRLGWIWQFISTDDGVFKLGSILEAKIFSIDASLEERGESVEESEEVTGGLPTIGLAADINPHKMVNLFAEISGMTFGDYGEMYDAEIGARFIFLENYSIIANYRIFKIDVEDDEDDDYVDIEISGPSIGASIRF